MSALDHPTSAILVLRDRTNSDPQQVLVYALYDLVAAGLWEHAPGRRGLRRRRAGRLTPIGDEPVDLPQPLRTADAALRRALAELGGGSLQVDRLARWMARRARSTQTVAVRLTIDDLVARGLLERAPREARPGVVDLRPTRAGGALLAAAAIPPRAALSSRDPGRRAAAVTTLGPLGAAFVLAWAATPLGAGGFPAGAVGFPMEPRAPDGIPPGASGAVWDWP